MAKHNFTDTMDRGKLIAQRDRNRGLPTGKSAKGWNRKRRDLEAGTWAYTVAACRAGLAFVSSDALETYRRAVYPERFADETLTDVVAASVEAQRQAIADTF